MRTPALGKEMVFNNEWGPKIRSFLCKTRKGYGPNLTGWISFIEMIVKYMTLVVLKFVHLSKEP
jgi:hypothetical protein